MSFEVVADDLMAHASHLDGLADRMSTVVSAAKTASMSDDAYGLICLFLPPVINPMEEEGISALEAAAEGLGALAGNVKATATEYQNTDESNSKALQKTMRPT